MDAPSSVNPSHLNVQRIDEASVSPATSSPTVPSLSVLNNSRNTLVNKSTFNISATNNTYNVSSAPPSLDLLYESTAPNAILNSGGRADEVRCHPGTRKEVIGLVERSIAQEHSGPRMLWLSGPAGAGKSAIMQTVAERCEKRGVPHANFFFFRADSSRNDASALVATLMHQIILLYPSVGPAVAATLVSNPLLFQTSLQKQFDALLHRTFPAAQDSSSALPPLVLLIDGLDECDCENKTAQRQLLRVLDTLLIQRGPYFRVVVASRVEPQISMAFKQLHSQVDSIFLDKQYSPERDIRLFVTSEFEKIKATHFLARTLGSAWPASSDVDGIVSKSSGQFIYAATAMRFIAHSSASPVLSLQKVQGIVPPAKNTPFAQLDAIYAYILAQVDDLEAVTVIFAIKLLKRDDLEGIKTLMELYQSRLTQAVFDSCLSELTALVNISGDNLDFFHASFADFLRDKTRAGDYHVDLKTFCTGAIPTWWVPRLSWEAFIAFTVAQNAFDQITQPTPDITAVLINPHPLVLGITDNYAILRKHLKHLTYNLNRIYAPHDVRSFIKIMHKWTSIDPSLAEFFPRDLLQSITLEKGL